LPGFRFDRVAPLAYRSPLRRSLQPALGFSSVVRGIWLSTGGGSRDRAPCCHGYVVTSSFIERKVFAFCPSPVVSRCVKDGWQGRRLCLRHHLLRKCLPVTSLSISSKLWLHVNHRKKNICKHVLQMFRVLFYP